MVDTYIVYNDSGADILAVGIIEEKRGFIPHPIPVTTDPEVPNSQRDDNNIVCVGLWIANPYVPYYFPKLHYTGERLAGEFGISADGKRVIYTKKRANGTTVTVVGGITAEDTLRAATDFAINTVSPLIPGAAAAATIVGTIVLGSR